MEAQTAILRVHWMDVRVTAAVLSDAEILSRYDSYVSRIPIIFVPGFGGTELHDGNDNLIWANLGSMLSSDSDSFLDVLRLNNDGSSNQIIRPTKVISTVGENLSNIYKTFILFLTDTNPD